MRRLEEFIAGNRQEFEDHHPSNDHEDKFRMLLNDRERMRKAEQFERNNRLLKIAAALLILLGFGFGILAVLNNPADKGKDIQSGLPPELTEMEQYYTGLTKNKLERINALTKSNPDASEVRSMLLQNISRINQSSEQLKSEYIGGNHDERLVDAIKNNYRIMSDLLDKVVGQLVQPSGKSSKEPIQQLKKDQNGNIIS